VPRLEDVDRVDQGGLVLLEQEVAEDLECGILVRIGEEGLDERRVLEHQSASNLGPS
jgi:hypothetical protein